MTANKVKGNQQPLEGAEFELFKKAKDGSWISKGKLAGTGDDQNVFEWKGLDDGDYKIVETKTPSGYNTIDPIEFKITAEHDTTADKPELKTLSGGDVFTGDVTTGAVSATIVNKSGSTLPETGGIGTTVFYVIGGMLMAAAAVLLITKKRMNNK